MSIQKLRQVNLVHETKKEIYHYIDSMDLQITNKLPREEKLAEMIGVSRITIRSALNELASEGIIFRRQGKGTFVNRSSMEIQVKFNPVGHFRDMIEKSGYKPSVKVLGNETIRATQEIAESLNIAIGSELICVSKIFYADQDFCAYCKDYVSKELLGELKLSEINKYENSIFNFIYTMTGKKITWEKTEIDTVTHLEIPELNQHICTDGEKAKALLLIRGIDYDEEDQPLVYMEEYIDTKIIKYNMIRQRLIEFP